MGGEETKKISLEGGGKRLRSVKEVKSQEGTTFSLPSKKGGKDVTSSQQCEEREKKFLL